MPDGPEPKSGFEYQKTAMLPANATFGSALSNLIVPLRMAVRALRFGVEQSDSAVAHGPAEWTAPLAVLAANTGEKQLAIS